LSSVSAACSEDSQDIILVYPFVGGSHIETAAKGLKLSSFDEKQLSLQELTTLQKESAKGRAHFLTLRRED